LPDAGKMHRKRRAAQEEFAMARWDKYWRDEAYVSRNWLDPDPDVVRLNQFMQDHQVRRVLDLGCGVGRHLVYLSSQGFEMHGLDLSPAGVERCQKELAQHQQQATVQVADMFAIPYPDQWFDWVLTQLTSLQRHVVLRYFMEGATEQEIANELGIRQQSVNAAKRGAITKLRKLIQ